MTIISNEAYATAIIKAAADPYDSDAVLNLVKFTQAIGYMPFALQHELSAHAFHIVPHLIRSEAMARVRSYMRGLAAPSWPSQPTARKTP